MKQYPLLASRVESPYNNTLGREAHLQVQLLYAFCGACQSSAMDQSQKMNMPLRLSVSEAARLFGLSDKTIRDALKMRDIKYIVIKGRYKINFESLLSWTQRTARRQNKLKRFGMGKFVKEWNPQSDSS